MKKINIFILITVFLASLAAAQSSEMAKPGMTPESPFYFLDRFSESLELSVAQAPLVGSEELEAKVRANHAEERLSEARKLIELNRSDKAENLMDEYSNGINRSIETSRRVNNSELNQRLGEVSDNHLKVLNDVKNRVPDQAQPSIQKAINKTQNSRGKIGKPDKKFKNRLSPGKKAAKNPEPPKNQSENLKGSNEGFPENKSQRDKPENLTSRKNRAEKGEIKPDNQSEKAMNQTGNDVYENSTRNNQKENITEDSAPEKEVGGSSQTDDDNDTSVGQESFDNARR